MKAAVYKRYGPPEVVSIQDIAKPVFNDDEILIRIYATTVNRTDCGFRSAEYFISRFWSGLFRPKNHVLGCEFAGVVEQAGKNAKLFKPGDRVFGFNDKTFGGHAEYLALSEKKAIGLMPAHFSYEEAAPLTEGAHYALCDIRASKIKEGQNVLVYGATGAIGSAAVQLLKHFGVKVVAVCNTKNTELVKSLGADVVIDYQTEDFTQTSEKFDFIFDAVGKSSFKQCKPLLNKKGVYISTELGKNSQNVFLALFTPLFGGKRVLFPIPTISKQDLELIKSLAEKGSFKPVTDRIYSFEQITDAYHYVESGQKTGNVVINLV